VDLLDSPACSDHSGWHPPGGDENSERYCCSGKDRLWDYRVYGTCPPPGSMIRYRFRVYRPDAMPDLPEGSDNHTLIAAMKGHVLPFGQTVAICSRQVIHNPRSPLY